MRRAWTAGLVVLLIATLWILPTTLLGGEKTYDVEVLKSPSGTSWYYPWDINDSERIAGFYWWVDGGTWRTTAIVWPKASAAPEALEPLTDDVSTLARSINNRGEVAGRSGDFPYHAVIWDKDGEPQDMHPSSPFSKWSEIFEINDLGDAAGLLYVEGVPRPYLWPSDDSGGILPLYHSSSIGGTAFSVNKKGWVAGEELRSSHEGHAVVWDASGTPEDLHAELVEALPDVKYSRAWKITDDGVVAGLAFDGFPTRPDLDAVTEGWAWTWSEEDGVIVVDRGDTDYAAIWGGDGKTFAGFIEAANWEPEKATGAVWLEGNDKGKTVYTLNEVPMLSGYTGMQVLSANTSGRIVGVAYDADGNDHAWFATPRSE